VEGAPQALKRVPFQPVTARVKTRALPDTTGDLGFSLRDVAGAAQNFSWQDAGHFCLIDHGHAVD
jgi:hypothetical protein